jgi:hypothetical protein
VETGGWPIIPADDDPAAGAQQAGGGLQRHHIVLNVLNDIE